MADALHYVLLVRRAQDGSVKLSLDIREAYVHFRWYRAGVANVLVCHRGMFKFAPQLLELIHVPILPFVCRGNE